MKTLFLIGDAKKHRLTDAVQRAGYYTVCEPDADTTLILLAAIRANLFVIDVGDLSVDGERTLQRLRALREHRHTPVIVIGAHQEQYRQLAQRVGVGEVMLAGEDGADHVLARVRQLLLERRPEVVEEVAEPLPGKPQRSLRGRTTSSPPLPRSGGGSPGEAQCARN